MVKVRIDEGDEDIPPSVREVEVKSLRTGSILSFEDGDRTSTLDKIGPPSTTGLVGGYDLVKKQVRDHEAMAKRAFAGHVIWGGHATVYPGLRKWHFRNASECSAYNFDLVVWSNYLFVGGDISECVWRRCDDMLSWSAGAINSISYFAEKVAHPIATEEWCGERSYAWVMEEYARQVETLLLDGGLSRLTRSGKKEDETIGHLTETRDDLLSAVDSGKEGFISAFYGSGWCGGDFPGVDRFTPTFMWARSAVKTALRLLGYTAKE